MDYSKLSQDKQEYYQKLINDTEEIIKNFRALSGLIRSKNDEKKETIYTIDKKNHSCVR